MSGRLSGLQEEHLDAWPRWAPLAAAVPAVLFAALTPLVHFEGERHPVLYLLLAVATIPWLVEAAGRRLSPWVFGALVFVPVAAINWATGPLGLHPNHDAQLSLMILIWAVGCLWATNPPTVSVPMTGLAVLVPLGRFLQTGFDPWPFWTAGLFVAAGTGAVMHRQQGLLSELRSAQGALAEEAAGKERRRIAREVHDVIAHHLTVTMLHLTGARMALRRDPAEAEAALVEAERLGRQALADVRRTVGLLRTEDGGGADAALPGPDDLVGLVDDYATAGIDATVECSADLAGLSPAAGLAVYRSVQEALANVAKHAPGARVEVRITEVDGRIEVRVTDDGRGGTAASDGRGLGLLGMRERVEAVGGSVQSGPDGDGWAVTCVIPAGAVEP